MPAPRVRADHDQLKDIQNRVARQADAIEEVIHDIKARHESLLSGGWIGQGAQMYYREMEGMVFPTLQRLHRALANAAQVTARISQIFLEAEEEAGRAVNPGQASAGLAQATVVVEPPTGDGSVDEFGGSSGTGSGSKAGGSPLLDSFAAKFPQAAEVIKKSAAARKLIAEAEGAGVEFGGFAEDGPAASLGRPYTDGKKVYVPRYMTDKVLAASKFLFELNNGIREPKFKLLDAEAAKGSTGTLTARQYAYKTTELEVEGMLRMGQVWTAMKKDLGGGNELNRYDADFRLSDYQQVSGGKMTKDALVRNVLSRTYDTGTLRGKTVEQYYMEGYTRLSGGK